MPLFPVFIDLSKKKVLVVGGGQVATRKVKSLLGFTENVTVVAPEVSPELVQLFKEGRIKLKKRRFMQKDLEGVDLVVVAVDNLKLQRRIYRLCERRGILCNAVDSPDLCSFIFPSLVVRGDLVIGISTSGKVPGLSRRVREIIQRCLPEDIERILEDLRRERESMTKGEERQRRMRELIDKVLPLSEDRT
jgi:precorrin-2 dehydrogenase/sirohydrochlorin ferrochelatase